MNSILSEPKPHNASGGLVRIKKTSNLCRGADRFFDHSGVALVQITGWFQSKENDKETMVIGSHPDKSFSLFKICGSKMSWMVYGMSEKDIPHRERYSDLSSKEFGELCNTSTYCV